MALGTEVPLNFDPAFSKQLRELRRKSGMSVTELATALGVSRPTVWSWESARNRPRKKHIAALAATLGVTEAEILLGAANRDEPARLPDQKTSKSLPVTPVTSLLVDVINRAKADIANAAGTEPGKVRIIVEI